MAVGSTNYTDLGWVKETVRGETPATPNFQSIPVVSPQLSENITTGKSEAIRSDRQTDDLIVLDSEPGGAVGIEVSYEPYKEFFKSLMQNGSSVTVSGTGSLAITGSTLTTDGDFVPDGVIDGMFILLDGFSDPLNNRIYRVSSVTSPALSLSPTPNSDDTAASGVYSTDRAVNGAQVFDTYTLREQINNPGQPTAIWYRRGHAVDKISLDFQTGEILKGSLDFIGMTAGGTATPIAGEVVQSVVSHDLMNSVTSVSEIAVGGLSSSTSFSSMTVDIMNNINRAKAIGTLGAVDLAAFSLEVTGNISTYFEDLSTYNLFKAGGAFSVYFILSDVSGNQMVVDLPYCKFSENNRPIEGKDNFLMDESAYEALRDPVKDYTVGISFFDA